MHEIWEIEELRGASVRSCCGELWLADGAEAVWKGGPINPEDSGCREYHDWDGRFVRLPLGY